MPKTFKVSDDVRRRLAKYIIFKPSTTWKDQEWTLDDDVWDRLQQFDPEEKDPNTLITRWLDSKENVKPS